jgi:hypothetical protein
MALLKSRAEKSAPEVTLDTELDFDVLQLRRVGDVPSGGTKHIQPKTSVKAAPSGKGAK